VPADDALIARISERLLRSPEPIEDETILPDWVPDDPFEGPPVPAAVLIALVRRPDGLNVLYTERSAALRAHSGQISFPGGRMEPEDKGPANAALREAAEEVALDPAEAVVLGFMPRYFTGTNYLITPVVAVVEPSEPFVPNPAEVSSVFEVPLSWLADERSYQIFRIRRGDVEHTTWQIDHSGIRIWGITANLTRRFRDLALSGELTW
jgi:8-oxo-dGTP pyrophosphatase MutT (NUDIX family)